MGFLIPWACLMDREVFPNKKASTMPCQRKNFSQALGNTCDIPLSQLPTPFIKGDMLVVRFDKEDYLVGLEDCKTISMVRLFYLRGINLSHTLI